VTVQSLAGTTRLASNSPSTDNVEKQAERLRSKLQLELDRLGNRLQTHLFNLDDPQVDKEKVREHLHEATTALLETVSQVTSHTLGAANGKVSSYLFIVGLEGFCGIVASVLLKQDEFDTGLPSEVLDNIKAAKNFTSISKKDVTGYVDRVIDLIFQGIPKRASPKKSFSPRKPTSSLLSPSITGPSPERPSRESSSPPRVTPSPKKPRVEEKSSLADSPTDAPSRQEVNNLIVKFVNTMTDIIDIGDSNIGESVRLGVQLETLLKRGIAHAKARLARGEFTQEYL